jgi:hypothetical protein
MVTRSEARTEMTQLREQLRVALLKNDALESELSEMHMRHTARSDAKMAQFANTMRDCLRHQARQIAELETTNRLIIRQLGTSLLDSEMH